MPPAWQEGEGTPPGGVAHGQEKGGAVSTTRTTQMGPTDKPAARAPSGAQVFEKLHDTVGHL